MGDGERTAVPWKHVSHSTCESRANGMCIASTLFAGSVLRTQIILVLSSLNALHVTAGPVTWDFIRPFLLALIRWCDSASLTNISRERCNICVTIILCDRSPFYIETFPWNAFLYIIQLYNDSGSKRWRGQVSQCFWKQWSVSFQEDGPRPFPICNLLGNRSVQ